MPPLCPQDFNCTTGDISGESAGHARTRIFSTSISCVQILATCDHASSCCTLRWWSCMNGATMGLRILSWYHCAFKIALIKCTCVRGPYRNPTATVGLSIHNAAHHHHHNAVNQLSLSKTWIDLWRQLLKANATESVHFPLKSVLMRNYIWPSWGWRGYRRASLRWFLAVCGDVFWSVKPIVAAAVQAVGLKPSWRWRCYMRRSWADVVTHGLQLVGLHSSLKCLWRQLVVDKWILSSQACGWDALCDKTAPGRINLFCGQPRACLCNNHATLLQWMD